MPDKVDIAYIKIWDILVGAVSWDPEKEYGTFAFDTEFLNKKLDLAPILMPVSTALQKKEPIFEFRSIPFETFKGLPGLLSDSLPDKFGNNIINSWLARQGRTPSDFSPVERLCYTGKRGMGALEFSPVINKEIEISVPIEITGLLELAQDIINERYKLKTSLKKEDALKNILRVGTSAGGNRPKAVIAYNEKTAEIRSGQVKAPKDFSYWILKFDGIKDEALGDHLGFGRIEYAYSNMAKCAGIFMTECKLHNENNRAHFMTQRFDRKNGEKLHSQTLCAIAHFDYNSPGAYSYEQAFQVARELKLPYTDIEQLYRRMVFNAISRNQDDHTKNISFLMDKTGAWRLSPAYDVIYSYRPSGQWTSRHQMSINGKRDDLSLDDLYEVAISNTIKSYKHIINEIIDTVSKWKEFAKEAGVEKSFTKEISNNHRLTIAKSL